MVEHDHIVRRTKVQIPEQVAGRGGGDQQFLRIPPGGVAAEALVRRTTSDLYAAAHRTLPRERKRWLADHRAIVAACRAQRTADAVIALTSHLAAARDFVLEQMPDDR
jgi:hypothetical protein